VRRFLKLVLDLVENDWLLKLASIPFQLVMDGHEYTPPFVISFFASIPPTLEIQGSHA
jgi:hypothetical protein